MFILQNSKTIACNIFNYSLRFGQADLMNEGFLSVDLGETPKQKPLHYITGYDFGLHLYTNNQRHSLQQYAEIPDLVWE